MSETVRTPPFAPFEWLLSGRYLRARRKEGFISVIAGFSFLGIMLGVATLIIVMAVMNGFRKELLDKILGLNGHLLVQPLESPLTDWKDVADRISQVPGIRLAAPVVDGQGLEDELVDQGEDRSVGADAEGQRKDGDRGEEGSFPEAAQGIANVLRELAHWIHTGDTPSVREGFAIYCLRNSRKSWPPNRGPCACEVR